MINSIIRYGIFFVILMLAQLLVFNNIEFSGYVSPFIYLLFLLVLPVETAAWLLLLLSFFTGFLMDAFVSTPGMHTSATLVAGFIRPYVLKLVSPRDGYEPGAEPSLHSYGFKWYITYAGIIVLIHHFVLFFAEVLSLHNFLSTSLRIMLSALFSVLFIVLIELFRKGKSPGIK